MANPEIPASGKVKDYCCHRWVAFILTARRGVRYGHKSMIVNGTGGATVYCGFRHFFKHGKH